MFAIQLDGQDSDIRVSGVGSMNTIRGAGREKNMEAAHACAAHGED